MSEKEDGGPAFPCMAVGPQGDTHGDWGMSLRTYAAIQLREPDSGIAWLDDMIRKAKRDDFAAQALAAVMRRDPRVITKVAASWGVTDREALVVIAYDAADAMMEARK